MNDEEIAALPSATVEGTHLKDWANRRLMPPEGGPWCWHWVEISHWCVQCAAAFDLPVVRSA